MGLQTQSGKLEFESSSLKRFAPGRSGAAADSEVRSGLGGPACHRLYAKYPLHLISPHPRFTFHTQSDGKDSTINDISDHRVLIDGYYYWIVRINSRDAAERGIARKRSGQTFQ